MTRVPYQPRYSGPHRSGTCVCGHSVFDHHLCCVMNEDYLRETGESYVPCECEWYDCNEGGGLDAEGNPHCFQYRDTLDTPEG